VPVIGRYTASRLHAAGNHITFVCPDSAPSKCINWGYFPSGGIGLVVVILIILLLLGKI
jgi:hypothetical protein